MRSLNEWWRDNLSTTARNTTKMLRNSFNYGQYNCVGYNPTTGNIIVSDFGSVKDLERDTHWKIQKETPYPVHIYIFELADGKLHCWQVPTNFVGKTPHFSSENFEPNQDHIQSWKDRGAKFLAHTIHFHQLPKCLEWQ